MSREASSLLLVAAIALATTAPLLAAGPKAEIKGPIKVTARHAEFDERGKRMLYRGNVRLVSSEIELLGERLELRQSGKGLYEATITGSPARLTHAGATDASAISARAREIVYNTRAESIALSGDAVLVRGTDELTSEVIHYNAVTRRVRASGSNGKQVRLVIEPPKEGEEKK